MLALIHLDGGRLFIFHSQNLKFLLKKVIKHL